MPIMRNIAKSRLSEGRTVLGLGVRHARSVEIGLIAAASGFDFLMIDREHSALDMGSPRS